MDERNRTMGCAFVRQCFASVQRCSLALGCVVTTDRSYPKTSCFTDGFASVETGRTDCDRRQRRPIHRVAERWPRFCRLTPSYGLTSIRRRGPRVSAAICGSDTHIFSLQCLPSSANLYTVRADLMVIDRLRRFARANVASPTIGGICAASCGANSNWETGLKQKLFVGAIRREASYHPKDLGSST